MLKFTVIVFVLWILLACNDLLTKKIKEMKRSMKKKVDPLIGIMDFSMAFIVRVMCSFD